LYHALLCSGMENEKMEANKKNGIYYMTGGFYIVIIAVLSVITFWFNRYLAIGELALSLVLFAVNYIYKRHTKKKSAALATPSGPMSS